MEPLVLHAEEAGLLVEKLQIFMGQQFNEAAFSEALMGLDHLSYPQFLYIVENKFLTNMDSEIISTAVTELFEEYVVEVIKKVADFVNNSLKVNDDKRVLESSVTFHCPGEFPCHSCGWSTLSIVSVSSEFTIQFS